MRTKIWKKSCNIVKIINYKVTKQLYVWQNIVQCYLAQCNLYQRIHLHKSNGFSGSNEIFNMPGGRSCSRISWRLRTSSRQRPGSPPNCNRVDPYTGWPGSVTATPRFLIDTFRRFLSWRNSSVFFEELVFPKILRTTKSEIVDERYDFYPMVSAVSSKEISENSEMITKRSEFDEI